MFHNCYIGNMYECARETCLQDKNRVKSKSPLSYSLQSPQNTFFLPHTYFSNVYRTRIHLKILKVSCYLFSKYFLVLDLLSFYFKVLELWTQWGCTKVTPWLILHPSPSLAWVNISSWANTVVWPQSSGRCLMSSQIQNPSQVSLE